MKSAATPIHAARVQPDIHKGVTVTGDYLRANRRRIGSFASRFSGKVNWRAGASVRLLGRRNGAAVDDVFRSRDGSGMGRDEEGDEVCHFSWLRRAPDRDAAE